MARTLSRSSSISSPITLPEKTREYYDVVQGVRGSRVSGYHQTKPVLDRPNPPQWSRRFEKKSRRGYADYLPNGYIDVKKIVVRWPSGVVTSMAKADKKKEMTTREILCQSMVAHAVFPDCETASEHFVSCRKDLCAQSTDENPSTAHEAESRSRRNVGWGRRCSRFELCSVRDDRRCAAADIVEPACDVEGNTSAMTRSSPCACRSSQAHRPPYMRVRRASRAHRS